jgi:meso-butanediol dehydrogenase/(S,S)-butanediol dehydrogenase/diacetyl reductase
MRIYDASSDSLRSRAALVTGADGPIGAATVRAFVRRGADITLVGDRAEALEAIVNAIGQTGSRIRYQATDITVSENCREVVSAAVSAFGRLDTLCNVANVFVPAAAADMAPADFAQTLAINMAAPFYLFQAAIPFLIQSGGSVVNVTSCAGSLTQPNTAAYSASKAGMNHLTRVLAKEYADQPVRINAIAPGAIAVDLEAREGRLDPREVQRKAQGGRGMIPVDELAEAIVFLASDEASAYHGAIIAMDKGIGIG